MAPRASWPPHPPCTCKGPCTFETHPLPTGGTRPLEQGTRGQRPRREQRQQLGRAQSWTVAATQLLRSGTGSEELAHLLAESLAPESKLASWEAWHAPCHVLASWKVGQNTSSSPYSQLGTFGEAKAPRLQEQSQGRRPRQSANHQGPERVSLLLVPDRAGFQPLEKLP